MRRLAFGLFIGLVSQPIIAQHKHHTNNTKSAALIVGLGTHHHLVSTKNREAQRFFDQGLSLIYAFNHEEAAKAFRRAAELDQNLAMAYWGIALAVGPNYNEPTIDLERMKAAYEAIQKALALSAQGPEHERAYIIALAKRFTLDPQPDPKRLSREYKDAMKELAHRYPDDLDAGVLYADSLMNLNPWQLWTKDGKPAPGTEEIIAVLENVLKRDPNHLGANHLYIHAVEASPSPERALPSAQRLGTLAPAAGHLVHMPGHIYIRTGDYEASAKANEAAAEADRAYIHDTGARGMYTAMYYSHNLHFLVESYGRMGSYREALRSAEQLSEHARLHLKDMPMVESFLPSTIFIKLRFAHWDEALHMAAPERSLVMTNAIWHFARGVAFAATGRVSEAQKEKKIFLDIAKGIPNDAQFGLNSLSSVLKIAEHVLDARIAWAQGNKAAAIAFWRQAVGAQDALNYDEPPGWYYPVRESLGAALLQSGSLAESEQIFRDDLKMNPRNGRSLFGLMESLKAQGKTVAASLVEREFERAWKNADAKLRIDDL